MERPERKSSWSVDTKPPGRSDRVILSSVVFGARMKDQMSKMGWESDGITITSETCSVHALEQGFDPMGCVIAR